MKKLLMIFSLGLISCNDNDLPLESINFSKFELPHRVINKKPKVGITYDETTFYKWTIITTDTEITYIGIGPYGTNMNCTITYVKKINDDGTFGELILVSVIDEDGNDITPHK